ncbi:DinB family protein [Actinopolymorpha alba]|uniref:DinB family protein n=1 Tax=Actinopolymorpha alba TaxID=533267 RepID=UPI0003714C70|nr:DinB family protein [Actinopolymorpha alba]
MTWTAPAITRIDEPFVADERAMLEGFLEWERATLLHKCAGLTGEQLALRPVAPSTLSLLGLVRHLASVERHWFRRRFRGEAVEPLFSREGVPGVAFSEVDPSRAEADFDCLMAEWSLCRRAVAGAALDETFITEGWGEMSLRWLYQHMINEYARHNGHADLLRERIDGRVGA